MPVIIAARARPVHGESQERIATTRLLQLQACAKQAFIGWLAAVFRSDRRVLVIVHDMVAAALSLPLALWLRLGGEPMDNPLVHEALPLIVPLFSLMVVAFGYLFRVHHGVWRHTALHDLIAIAKTATASIALLCLVLFLDSRLLGMPRSVPLIQWFVLVALLSGSRILYRVSRDGKGGHRTFFSRRSNRIVPVLLIGTDSGAALFIRALAQAGQQPFSIAGIVELDKGQTGLRILGHPVLGRLEDLNTVIRMLAASGNRPGRLVITDPIAPPILEHLVGAAARHRILLCRVPEPLAFREASSASSLELRPVALEDLLNRPQVQLDDAAINRLVAGRRVLVTGAGGSIGSELVRQLASRKPASLTLLDNGEYNLYAIDHEIGTSFPGLCRRAVMADVRQRQRLLQLFQQLQPELVFHAAALKHVPLVELNPSEGVLTNAIGTRNVADAVAACGAAAMVLISTDKAVNPTNVMGASKRLAEFYCQALDAEAVADGPSPRFITVRFGNVLGSSGSVVPLFQKQLAAGQALTVTHPDIERFFMTIPEAVSLTLHASAHGAEHDDERGRVLVLDMGQPIRIVDIAQRLIRLAGLEPGRDAQIAFTGLRPGEKLYEELFDTTERRLPSTLQGVHMAVSQPMELARLSRSLEQLGAICARDDRQALRTAMAALIPGYLAPAPGEAARAA